MCFNKWDKFLVLSGAAQDYIYSDSGLGTRGGRHNYWPADTEQISVDRTKHRSDMHHIRSLQRATLSTAFVRLLAEYLCLFLILIMNSISCGVNKNISSGHCHNMPPCLAVSTIHPCAADIWQSAGLDNTGVGTLTQVTLRPLCPQ